MLHQAASCVPLLRSLRLTESIFNAPALNLRAAEYPTTLSIPRHLSLLNVSSVEGDMGPAINVISQVATLKDLAVVFRGNMPPWRQFDEPLLLSSQMTRLCLHLVPISWSRVVAMLLDTTQFAPRCPYLQQLQLFVVEDVVDNQLEKLLSRQKHLQVCRLVADERSTLLVATGYCLPIPRLERLASRKMFALSSLVSETREYMTSTYPCLYIVTDRGHQDSIKKDSGYIDAGIQWKVHLRRLPPNVTGLLDIPPSLDIDMDLLPNIMAIRNTEPFDLVPTLRTSSFGAISGLLRRLVELSLATRNTQLGDIMWCNVTPRLKRLVIELVDAPSWTVKAQEWLPILPATLERLATPELTLEGIGNCASLRLPQLQALHIGHCHSNDCLADWARLLDFTLPGLRELRMASLLISTSKDSIPDRLTIDTLWHDTILRTLPQFTSILEGSTIVRVQWPMLSAGGAHVTHVDMPSQFTFSLQPLRRPVMQACLWPGELKIGPMVPIITMIPEHVRVLRLYEPLSSTPSSAGLSYQDLWACLVTMVNLEEVSLPFNVALPDNTTLDVSAFGLGLRSVDLPNLHTEDPKAVIQSLVVPPFLSSLHVPRLCMSVSALIETLVGVGCSQILEHVGCHSVVLDDGGSVPSQTLVTLLPQVMSLRQ